MENNEQAWGKLLKYYRQKKKQKQDDVAFGICTPSYLSRIENGIVVAEHSMYEQLFENLGIDFNKLEQQLKSQTTFLEQLYEKLLSNAEFTAGEIEQLTVMQNDEPPFEQQLMAKLVYARFLYSIKEDDRARTILNEIEPFVSWKKDRITQLFVAITAFGHLSFQEFEQLSIKEENDQLAQLLSNTNPFELANYHYHIAFANHRSYKLQKALQHIELAQQFFTHQYKPLFQLKLYSMKGVIFNDSHRFQEALKEFEAGLNLLANVPSIQTPMQWSSLHNNIAYCYECQENYMEASKHYKSANDYDEDLHSAINWMRTCFAQKDFKQLNILLKRYEEQQFTVPHHIYQRRLLAYAVETEYTIHGLKLLEDEAFPHFNEQQYYSLILFYAPLWAQFYEQLHAYKQASHCFKQALYASEKIRQRMSS